MNEQTLNQIEFQLLSVETQEAVKAAKAGAEAPSLRNTESALNQIARAGEAETSSSSDADLQLAESDYIASRPQLEGLRARYDDPQASRAVVWRQITEYCADGQSTDTVDLPEGAFDDNCRDLVEQQLGQEIDRLLLSLRNNPEKHGMVRREMSRYLDLVRRAQQEGDLDPHLSASDVFHMAQENVWLLAYQDRVASENLLGDHGIRHLVDHNIRVTDQILDGVAKQGQEVKGIDLLIAHQAMIFHDLGYVADPVRLQVNQGTFSADRGHNVLSARYFREEAQGGTGPLAKVFKQEQLAVMHACVLNHDSSEVRIQIQPEATVEETQNIRNQNIESAIHLADNTHAFEDKLPELLYNVPESLQAMRLLKTAGEIGRPEDFDLIKNRLLVSIDGRKDLSADDKQALNQAVGVLTPDNYRYAVGRICGNKPTISVEADGKVQIEIQESAIHQEVVGLFGQESYDQFRKFVADLKGISRNQVSDEMLNSEQIEAVSGRVAIRLIIGEARASEKTDYQQRIEQTVADPVFRDFVLTDTPLSLNQMIIESRLKVVSEGDEKARLESSLIGIKQQRQENLKRLLIT